MAHHPGKAVEDSYRRPSMLGPSAAEAGTEMFLHQVRKSCPCMLEEEPSVGPQDTEDAAT